MQYYAGKIILTVTILPHDRTNIMLGPQRDDTCDVGYELDRDRGCKICMASVVGRGWEARLWPEIRCLACNETTVEILGLRMERWLLEQHRESPILHVLGRQQQWLLGRAGHLDSFGRLRG